MKTIQFCLRLLDSCLHPHLCSTRELKNYISQCQAISFNLHFIYNRDHSIIHKVRTGKIRIFDTSYLHRTRTYKFKYPSYPTIRTKIIFFKLFYILNKILILTNFFKLHYATFIKDARFSPFVRVGESIVTNCPFSSFQKLTISKNKLVL